MDMPSHGWLRTEDTCIWGLNSGLLAWRQTPLQLAILLAATQLKCVKHVVRVMLSIYELLKEMMHLL